VVNWQDRLNPQSGGAEIHLHEIFGRMARWGHDVTLLASGFAGAEAEEEVDGIRVCRVGGRMTFGLAVPGVFRRWREGASFDVVVEDLNKVPVFTPFLTSAPVVLLVHHLFGTTAFQVSYGIQPAAESQRRGILSSAFRGLGRLVGIGRPVEVSVELDIEYGISMQENRWLELQFDDPKPGLYQITLRVRDVNNGTEYERVQQFMVTPPPETERD